MHIGGTVPSADESLKASVADLIGPGSGHRKHTVYLGIGEKNDNPAVRYFEAERTYYLANSVDWNVVWVSNNRVRIYLYECPSYKSLRTHPDPECRELEALDLERGEAEERFHVFGAQRSP
ncbi:MAG TPA: hypothetical protein VFP44_21085, partial [Usitatibacter sp.]|nr:hypothetical protein [Usitatibacter sp.]